MNNPDTVPNPATRFAPRVIATTACIAALGIAGCQSITAGTTEAAQVRFVNISHGAPPVDLYVNETGVAYNVSFGTVTSYVPLASGEYRLSANRANTGQALVSAHAALGSRRQYTAILGGSASDMQTILYPDANAPAPSGMLAVRVLNESAIGGLVDVYLSPGTGASSAVTPTVRDFGFGGSTGYEDLPADKTYAVAVVPAGTSLPASGGAVLSGVTVMGGSGAVRTVVITEASGAKGKAFTGFVLNDLDTP